MRRGTDVVTMLLFMSIHLNVKIISCSGRIEIQIDHVYNIYGTLMNGSCCEGMRSVSNRDFCTGTCRTYLTFCVGDVASMKDCKYGKIVTPVLGRHKNNIRFPITNDVGKQLIRDQFNKLSDSNREDVPRNIFENLLNFTIPDEPKSFSSSSSFGQKGYYVKMEARHKNSENTSSSPDPLISQQTYYFDYKLHNVWRMEPYIERGAHVIFHTRVLCNRFYFQDTCQSYCREHHDRNMNLNWRCLSDGRKECLPGWKGYLCDTAICNQTCNSTYGGCIRPNVCGCPLGYQGENCDQCIVDPDCVHARCVTSYQCLCLKGWGGRKCHIDLDICGKKHCKNGGYCIPNQDMDYGGYTCRCAAGFGGKNCGKIISPCHSRPCQHNGLCEDGAVDKENYTCHCPKGTSGRNCEKDVQYCASTPCANSGTCIEKFDGYECRCLVGWEGVNCTIDKNECASNPCVNAIHCKDLFNDYHCACHPGWSGKQCDKDVNDCKGQCRNNATCVDKVDDFLCQCATGYSGKLCGKNIDDCVGDPCLHNGVCVDLVGSYKCVCKTGYHGDRCEKQVNFCNDAPCKNGANCTRVLNDYRCDCPVQWTGKDCSIQSDFEKHCNLNLCQHNATCSIVNGTEVCHCSKGYKGQFCEIDMDNCLNNTCSDSGICVDRVDDYECVCLPGFSGRNCEINIDECLSSPCQNGGTCSDGINSYTCTCADGYQGYDCASNIDECVDNICQNGGTCVDGVNSFTCECRYSYYGRHCEIGPDHCYGKPCGNHGNCSQINGTFSCSCFAGYAGKTCNEDIDDCAQNPCRNGGVCIDKVNAYDCKCSLGHHGDVCQYNDTCVAKPCKNDGVCINQGNDYHCQCPRSYFGKDCSEVENMCFIPRYLNKARNMTTLVSSGYCTEHGTCRPLKSGGFTCDCVDGWTGERCQLKVDYCVNNNCENQATCLNIEGGYKCQCPNGYQGIYCQINTDDCSSSPCQNGGKCLDQQNDFLCECKHGWKGKTCSSKSSSCAYPNPCQNDGQCIDIGELFHCECKTNYVGKTCNVFVGPCDHERCSNGGTCLSNATSWSYVCQCRSGFFGQHCEEETKECAFKPCLHGGKCVEGPMMYNCECKPGYHGANCQFEVDECASMPCPHGMECVDKIATFECQCPLGRTGDNCEELVPVDYCQLGNTVRKHNESWEESDNTCTCMNSEVRCTKLITVPSNCFEKRRTTNCTCVAKLDADCITPPCNSWGECEAEDAQVAPVTTDVCMPDTGREQLGVNCAKVIIVFQRKLLPQGIHVERICEELRYLSVSRTYAESSQLKLLCFRTSMDSNLNMLNVSVNSKTNAAFVALELAKTFNSLTPQDNVLYNMLRAMINVTVEQQAHWSPLMKPYRSPSSFLIPIAAGIASIALLLLFVVAVYAFKRRRKAEELAPEIFFTKKKNIFQNQKPFEKNTNRERSLSKGDPHCELLDPNMYFEGSGKKFLPLSLGPRDEIVV